MMPHNKIMIPLFLFLLLFSTFSIALGETVILPEDPEEGIDTYISSSSIWDSGNFPLMLVSSDSAGKRTFSLVKFDLPSWLNTRKILNARLELYAKFVYAENDPAVTVNVHRVWEPWEEISVWSDFESLENYPDSQDFFDENIEDSELATAEGWMSFDVTDLVKDWISDFSSNYGVLLETPQSGEYRALGMCTSDWPFSSEYHPKLIIDYTETLPATVDFHPESLNLKSNGKWVTCYIELPEGHDVEDIDIGTIAITSIAMNGEEAEVGDCDGTGILAEDHPTEVGDYDGDGIPDLMVKFDRGCIQKGITDVMDEFDTQSVQDATSVAGLAKVKIKIYFETDLTGLKGVNADPTEFEGFDEVDIIDKGK